MFKDGYNSNKYPLFTQQESKSDSTNQSSLSLNPPSTHSHHTSQPKLTHSHSFSKNTPNPLTYHTTQTIPITQTHLS